MLASMHSNLLQSINPYTEEKIKPFEEDSEAQIQEKIQNVSKKFQDWRRLSVRERETVMAPLGQLLLKRKSEFARMAAEEMGKPIQQAEAEVEKCAWVCECYSKAASEFLADEKIKTDATSSYVSFQPLGVVLGIMPWNFPFWQVFRFAVPTLLAGNTVLLKHSSNVSGCALLMEEVFNTVSSDIFKTLLIRSENVQSAIKNPLVQAISLTGSTEAGRKVAALAGSLIKKTVLELGGSDPYVVLEDADLELAAETCAASRLINSGQSCVSAKRFIVVKKIQKAFEEIFVQKMRRRKMGDPLDRTTELGPLARKDLRDDLHLQVTDSISAGAKLLLGGQIPSAKGFMYPPTILSDVTPRMRIFSEETFGPVAAIIPAETEEQAIQFANATSFGLGAAVFTKDVERGNRIARNQLEAGNCFVNALVKSDPRLPFGGIKQSGFGRELSVFGIREFVNIKSVYVK